MGTESVIAYISCLMLTGLLGNILVVYAFGFKYRKSAFNILITTLAIYDLFSCIIHMPLDILGNLHPDILPYSILCKTACFLITLTVFSASIVLLCVAILRFRGISKPLARTLQPSEAKWLGVLTLVPSLGVSWPALVMFENKNITSDARLEINFCGIHNPEFKSYSVIFHILLVCLFVANLLALASLYGFIAKFLVNRKRVFSEGGQKFLTMATLTSNSLNEHSNMAGTPDNGTKRADLAQVHVSENQHLKPIPSFLANSNKIQSNNVQQKSKTMMRNAENIPKARRKDNRGILMMFLVTLVFGISYIPHLTYAMIFAFSDSETVISLSMKATTGILFRSYYINNIASPVIYILCSGDFRAEISNLFVKKK